MAVRVRAAPSPTGDPHVGTAYISLFDFAFAKREGGKFVLRIEDTDRARSTPESEEAIMRSLKWLGLSWDEGPDVGGPYGPYRQSERAEIYREHVQQLVDAGAAYYCFCTPERLAQMRKEQAKRKENFMYDGLCKSLTPEEARARAEAGEAHVVRLAVPTEGETTFHDLIRGKISVENKSIDDQVLLKSDGYPTYHLANVVDDHLMQITHVIRAEEWISSTPKHVLLYQAFGWEQPAFIHMPLLRNADKSKISKRRNPTSLDYYRQEGYLPEAMLNFLALMGYSFGPDREIVPLEEFVETFSWDRVGKSGPVFDLTKLDWINGEYIRKLSVQELADRLRSGCTTRSDVADDVFNSIVVLMRERLKKLSEFDEMTRYFFEPPEDYDTALLVQKKRTREETIEALGRSNELIEATPDFAAASTEAAFRQLAEDLGWKVGQLFMTLRIAITGRKVSAPLFETMEILGRQECSKRVQQAQAKLSAEG